MKITKTSPITGKSNTMDLNITQEQFDRWQQGELIQNAMPQLTPDEREFIISGCAPDEFDNLHNNESE